MNRRNGTDRRGWQPMPSVPFLDSDGYPVLWDRRQRADRRLNAIETQWVDPRFRTRRGSA